MRLWSMQVHCRDELSEETMRKLQFDEPLGQGLDLQTEEEDRGPKGTTGQEEESGRSVPTALSAS